MLRVDLPELLDDPALPESVVAQAYRDLARTHRWLGNTAVLLRLLRENPTPVRRVLDLGCGQGALLAELERALGVEGTGLDLRAGPASSPVRILRGDALRDALPPADVTLAVCLVHHLTPEQIVLLVRNVARSSNRLIVLDLVRHRVPLVLFRIFAPPLLHPINVADGLTSIRRAYTAQELARIVEGAVRGTDARVVHTISFGWTRQIMDIRW
ncbi:MAG: hypothetical protein IPJ19_12210 [Planctomycetes bacterium]|nr:hypothetical protein [Planctomycetota bacterium]